MSPTKQREYPHYQVLFTNNKAKTWYIAVEDEYPKTTLYKMKRTAKGYDFKKVFKIFGVTSIISSGYHHDYMSGEEVNAIEKFIVNTYLDWKTVKEFNVADDIPF
jgi:hypothetical protein